MLGVDLDEVLRAVGVRIGQELAGKWENIQDDVEFWKHLANEWSQLGMGEIVTKGMPPASVIVQNGGACDGNPNDGRMFCQLDEGILHGIVMERHNVQVTSKERICTSEGRDTCHFEIACQNEPLETPL
jgi:predicted hydrocarbon binding protein